MESLCSAKALPWHLFKDISLKQNSIQYSGGVINLSVCSTMLTGSICKLAVQLKRWDFEILISVIDFEKRQPETIYASLGIQKPVSALLVVTKARKEVTQSLAGVTEISEDVRIILFLNGSDESLVKHHNTCHGAVTRAKCHASHQYKTLSCCQLNQIGPL